MARRRRKRQEAPPDRATFVMAPELLYRARWAAEELRRIGAECRDRGGRRVAFTLRGLVEGALRRELQRLRKRYALPEFPSEPVVLVRGRAATVKKRGAP